MQPIEIPNFPGITIMEPRIIFIDEENEEQSINYVEDSMIENKIFVIPNNYGVVDETQIIACLNDILSVNNNHVTIEKVEWISKEDKIIIYSDKKLNTKYYINKLKIKNKDRVFHENDINRMQGNVLDSINKTLNEEQYCPKDAVSVSTLLKAHSMYMQKIEQQEEMVQEKLKNKIYEFYSQLRGNPIGIKLDFYFGCSELEIEIYEKGSIFDSYSEGIVFKLFAENHILPKNKNTSQVIYLYNKISKELYEFFDFYIKNEEFLSNNLSSMIATINSDYIININNENIESDFSQAKKTLLNVKHQSVNISEYEYSYEDINLLEILLLKDNLDKLYDKTFVKISDCPIFLQDILREIKTEKLEDLGSKTVESYFNEVNNQDNGQVNFKQKVKTLFKRKK